MQLNIQNPNKKWEKDLKRYFFKEAPTQQQRSSVTKNQINKFVNRDLKKISPLIVFPQ